MMSVLGWVSLLCGKLLFAKIFKTWEFRCVLGITNVVGGIFGIAFILSWHHAIGLTSEQVLLFEAG